LSSCPRRMPSPLISISRTLRIYSALPGSGPYALASMSMAERESYTPGTFCWVELSTPDQEAARSFYASLFGWQARDMPLPEGGVYSMMELGGRVVAAIAKQPEPQREAGVPALWNNYISVEDADAAAARAAEHGGTVHAPAFDVMQAGRMAVIQDPQGAYFMLWEPRATIGAALVNVPGALVWNELQSPDLDGSAAYYSAVFGWTVEQAAGMADRYLGIRNGASNNGGMRELTPPAPPCWLAYFGSEDLDASLAAVRQGGGSALTEPIDIGMARLAVVADPQGATFALYDGQVEP